MARDLNVGDLIRNPFAKKRIMRVTQKDGNSVFIQNIQEAKRCEVIQSDFWVWKVAI